MACPEDITHIGHDASTVVPLARHLPVTSSVHQSGTQNIPTSLPWENGIVCGVMARERSEREALDDIRLTTVEVNRMAPQDPNRPSRLIYIVSYETLRDVSAIAWTL
jgi:hypothetical protein